MTTLEPILISFNARPATPSSRYFARSGSNDNPTSRGSDLLNSIRNALRGSQGEPESPVTSVVFSQTSGSADEDELSWDKHTLFLSSGGVIRKKWSFEGEGQIIQWACVGWFEQPSTLASPSAARSAHYTSSDIQDETVLPDPKQRPTFGPFTRAEQERELLKDSTTRYRAVFVFLRGLGRIFFMNGLEYTFYLPFVVRRAWPLAPHGVIVQRLLEPGEFEEAAVSKDEPLPTTFAMVDPFAEASAVGLTAFIKNGRPSALDEHEPGTPIATIPAQEHLLWVSGNEADPLEQLALTLNMERNELSVWHYTYVDPKEGSESPSKVNRRASVVQPRHSRQSLSLSGTLPLSPRMAAAPPPTFMSALSDQPPLAALPGVQPGLSATMPMAALLSGSASAISQPKPVSRGRRNSLGQYDEGGPPSGAKIEGGMLNVDPVDSARMRPAYWIQKIYSEEIMAADAAAWRDITTTTYDRKTEGGVERTVLAICLPRSQTLLLIPLHLDRERAITSAPCARLTARAIAPVKATRHNIYDLLQVKSDGSLSLLTHGAHELPIRLKEIPGARVSVPPSGSILTLKDGVESSVTLCLRGGISKRLTLSLYPSEELTHQCLLMLAMVLPKDAFFQFHHAFLLFWSQRGMVNGPSTFDALSDTINATLGLDRTSATNERSPWETLNASRSATRFTGDPVLKGFSIASSPTPKAKTPVQRPHTLHVNFLVGLHYVAQNMLLSVDEHAALLRLVPIVCRLALPVRPEWADYWKRLVPDALDAWPAPAEAILEFIDDRLPSSAPDVYSSLYGQLNNPDWNAPEISTAGLILPAGTEPSWAFGDEDPLLRYHHVTAIYRSLSQPNVDSRKCAEGALKLLVRALESKQECVLDKLPLGLLAPLREALRTCQMSPAGNWPVTAYQLIQRTDLAEGINNPPNLLTSHGYRSVRDYLLPTFNRVSIHSLHDSVRRMIAGELSSVTGVELGLEEFTNTRFGQDKRVDEVARILCSSVVPSIKMAERPELGEFDTSREYQNHVTRIAERTLALPMGRAVFTFGSVQIVTREAYAIPRMEYSLRLHPQNVLVAPEIGKIPLDSLQWGNFHNGVAAGLRIAPTARGVESSWIKFNKPTDLSAEHAGFLFALGLTGHLREMLTWHTFSYLTPKHDFTSIAVLLGLSAANAGNSNRHVTKLLAVHTPALLPTPTVDLNVPMITQAAGLSGIGLLYMGTKNRRMAEVCLGQLNRRDLIQPDVTNEYRESYTLCAALAFGMVMLGKGSDVPADLALLSRLRALIHGEGYALSGVKPTQPSFDVNLTSPAATIALGFMYLRTERRDVADILTIPDTILNLEKVPPAQLLLRTLSRSLIMWDSIAATHDWIFAQVPATILRAVLQDAQTDAGKAHQTYDLAYWNIVAGACFAIGLKFAGTAASEAYELLLKHFDKFSVVAYSPGPLFEHRIRKAAIRDGLNLISISLSLIMAGTGDIHSLRRFRFSYGVYPNPLRYGTYGAIHASIGMLFLGGGRYTLGTSDAAIAALVTAFFPRFAQVSSDNRSYLQALRHLWVLAVEPRCLVARDVDTKEVVYLPVKLKVKDGKDVGTSQLIAPTLIPDVDRICSLRVDTPRYWPFYLDIVNFPHHKESLIRSQTLYVKRRTAFLSYQEDPKGSRSLFVRSGAGSTGDAAMLDFPQLKDSAQAPADLQHFISSHSNDPLFLAFADRFCRDPEGTDDEKLFSSFCHAALMDGILQDKTHSMQTHLTLYRYRRLPISSPFFGIAQQDLRFMAEFYSRIFERRFSGRSENNYRSPLVRESTLNAALYEQDQKLIALHRTPQFVTALREYARGSSFTDFDHDSSRDVSRVLSWYLQRNNVPVSTVLVVLKALRAASQSRCLEMLPRHGTQHTAILEAGMKEVLHAAGSKMTSSMGAGWSIRSVEEILATWSMEDNSAAARR